MLPGALQENGCLDLLELQDASQHLSWKAASANEVTFACYLANKLDIQHSIILDGQAQNPGLPSLREFISRSYGQARWLYELPGMATDAESDEWADGVKTIRIPRHLGIGIGTSRQGPPHCITSIQAGSMSSQW